MRAPEQELAEYREHLKQLSDSDFVDHAKDQIWLSAFASNNPRSKYHWQTDACYDEAVRRERGYLYKKAWNAAYRLAGYEPTAADVAGESPHAA